MSKTIKNTFLAVMATAVLLRGNGFRSATTDAGQLASRLQGHMQRHQALQRRMHLPDPYWNHRWVR